MISWPEKEQVCTTRPVASRLLLSLSLILVGSCFFRIFSSAKPHTNDVPGRSLPPIAGDRSQAACKFNNERADVYWWGGYYGCGVLRVAGRFAASAPPAIVVRPRMGIELYA